MAPGSGPEPTGQPSPLEAVAPEGWIRVPSEMEGGYHYRPDPRHPLHPYNIALRRNPRLLKQLNESEEIRSYVNTRRRHLQVAMAEIAIRRASDPAASDEHLAVRQITTSTLAELTNASQPL